MVFFYHVKSRKDQKLFTKLYITEKAVKRLSCETCIHDSTDLHDMTCIMYLHDILALCTCMTVFLKQTKLELNEALHFLTDGRLHDRFEYSVSF